MNERLAWLSDELADATRAAEQLDNDAGADIARQVGRVAEDLRALSFDPRYDVEGCDEHGCRVPARPADDSPAMLRLSLTPRIDSCKL